MDEWSSDAVHLPGYSSLKVLFENRRSIVLRGIRNATDEPCIIKLLNAEFPSSLQLWLFEQQYDLTRSLSHLDGIVKTLALERYRNTLYMVFEDAGGSSLRTWLRSKPPLVECLQVAIQVAASLGHIHQHNVVHRDINSNNVVYNAETHEAQIIDFGISILLTRESPKMKHSNLLEGTLQYISPEQTGRMNRSLDYRTDLYSFGVLLFEMFVGRLPFPSNDPTELVHCHIAACPPLPETLWSWPEQLPTGSAIARALSSIIMTLLAKNKEDRYQSAAGVKADLELCLKHIQAGVPLASITLHGRDMSSVLQIPERLYGREVELRSLMTCFNRVITSHGRTEVALVAGAGGVGKSRVVGELMAMIAATLAHSSQSAVFASGKFDQFTRRPFSAIIAAVTQLVDAALSQDAAQLTSIRARMLSDDGLGGNASVAIQLVPSIALITGPQPLAPPLGHTEAQNRLHRTFVALLRIFATQSTPLVLFVDDLQWADAPSLQLLQQLATDLDFRHCLIVGAYRDNEVNHTHPLTDMIEQINRASSCGVTCLTLKPLNRTLIVHLLVDTLKCGTDEPRTQRLAHLCMSKTHGNPFFVIELIRSLYAQDILNFNTTAGRWEWDEERAIQSKISRNVVEMMSSNIRSLPLVTQNLLKLASCIGTDFDLPTLATISGLDAKEVARGLWKALVAGLVVAAGENYFVMMDDDTAAEVAKEARDAGRAIASSPSPNASVPIQAFTETTIAASAVANNASLAALRRADGETKTVAVSTPATGAIPPLSDAPQASTGTDHNIGVGYRFMHDRVRQAAYSLVTPSEKPELHLRIGRLLLKKLRYPNDFNRVITMADDELLHWNESHQSSAASRSSSTSLPRAVTDGKTTATVSVDDATATPAAAAAEEIANNDKDSSLLMDVVSHLNRGQFIVTDHNERWQYAELNCYLAHRTRESTAFGQALTMALYGLVFMAPPRTLVAATVTANGATSDTADTKSRQERSQSTANRIEDKHDGDDSDNESHSSGGTSSSIGSSGSTSGTSGSGPHDDALLMDVDDMLLQPSSSVDYDQSVPSSIWSDTHRDLVGTRLYSLRLGLEYAVSNITDGDTWAKIAMTRTTRAMDKARLFSIQSISMIFRSNMSSAVDLGLQALAVMGHALPPEAEWGPHAGANFAAIKAQVAGKDIPRMIAELPPVATAEDRLVAQITAELSALAYLTSPTMLAAIATRSILSAFKSGLAADMSLLFTWFGVVSAGFGDRGMGSQFALQMEPICDRFKSLKYKGKCLMLQSATLLWCLRPFPQVFQTMDQAWNLLLSVGDNQWAGYQLMWIVHSRIVQGVPLLPLLGRLPRYLEWCFKCKHDLMVKMLQAAQLVMFNLVGATRDEKTFSVPPPVAPPTTSELNSNGNGQNGNNNGSNVGVSPMVGAGGLNVESLTDRALRRAGRRRGSSIGIISANGSPRAAVASPISIASVSLAGPTNGPTGVRRVTTSNNLSSREQRMASLSTAAVVEEEFLATAEAGKLHATIAMYHVWKARCLYLYGHLDEAWAAMEKAIALRSFIAMLSMELELVFGSAMILLARIGRILTARWTAEKKEAKLKKITATRAKDSDAESKSTTSPLIIPSVAISSVEQKKCDDEDKQMAEWWTIIHKSQADINTWLPGCPANFTHMALLIRAEIARWQKKPSTAIKLYGRAIDEAKKYEFNYHEALGAELCAEFFHSRNDMNLTVYWLKRSVHCYRIWGAKRKISIMKAKHRQFFDVRDSPHTGMRGLSANGTMASNVLYGGALSQAVQISPSQQRHHHSGSSHNTLQSPMRDQRRTTKSHPSSPRTSTHTASIDASSGSGSGSLGGTASASPSPPASSSPIAPLRTTTTTHGTGQPSSSPTGGAPTSATHSTTSGTHSSGSMSSQDRSAVVAALVGAVIPAKDGGQSTGTTGGGEVASQVIIQPSSPASASGAQPSSTSAIGSSSGTHSGTSSVGSGSGSSSSRTHRSKKSSSAVESSSRAKPSSANVGGTVGGGGGVAVAVANGVASAVRKRGINAQIDTQSILDAAQALSQEMKLERALMALMNILLSCAGAESGALISKRGSRWMIEAKATPHGCQVMPLSSPDDEYYDNSGHSTPIPMATRAPVSPVPGGNGSTSVVSSSSGKLFASRTDSNSAGNSLGALVHKRNHNRARGLIATSAGNNNSNDRTGSLSPRQRTTTLSTTASASSSPSIVVDTSTSTDSVTSTSPTPSSSSLVVSSASSSSQQRFVYPPTAAASSQTSALAPASVTGNHSPTSASTSASEPSPAYMYRLAALGSQSTAASTSTTTTSTRPVIVSPSSSSSSAIAATPSTSSSLASSSSSSSSSTMSINHLIGRHTSTPPAGLHSTPTGFSYRPTSQGFTSATTTPPTTVTSSTTSLAPTTSTFSPPSSLSSSSIISPTSSSSSSSIPTPSSLSSGRGLSSTGVTAEATRAHLAALSSATASTIAPSSPPSSNAPTPLRVRSSRGRGDSSSSTPDDDGKTTATSSDLPPLPVSMDPVIASLWMQLPLTLFNFVLHTGKSPILNDASADRQFSHDPYVQHFKPKSVMIVPFHLRNEIVSVLYLENNLTKGAFTADRLDMVKLLSSQAAISLENARLYTQLERHNRTLEEKVEHRTRQLREAQDVAERANMAKSLFLSTMSHEIRTPLNGVIGTTHLLLEAPQSLDADQTEMVETIRDSGQTLLALINDVLDLTKIESGKFELDLQPFDLRHCIESAMDVVAVKALAQGLDLAYFAANNVPVMAVADVTRVRQILTNLLSNAVKFTAKGQVVVTIEAIEIAATDGHDTNGGHDGSSTQEHKRSLSPASSTTTARASPPPRPRPPLQLHELHFAVRDSGIGIPMDRAHRLFQIFSQVNTDTSKHYGGTGLGLAISRHFAEMMGGEIWVVSEEGKGSTFHFTLRVPCGFDNPPDYLAPVQPQLVGRTAWLYDPCETIRQQLTETLTHWGVHVTTFDSWPAVVAALARGLEASTNGNATTAAVIANDGDATSSTAAASSSPSYPDVLLSPLHLQAGEKVTQRSPGGSSPGSSNNRHLPPNGGPRSPKVAISDTDGLRAITRLRSQSHHTKRKLPIILMCALSERKQEMKAVVNAFGSKPIKPGQLLKAVIASLTNNTGLSSSEASYAPSSRRNSATATAAALGISAAQLASLSTPTAAGISNRSSATSSPRAFYDHSSHATPEHGMRRLRLAGMNSGNGNGNGNGATTLGSPSSSLRSHTDIASTTSTLLANDTPLSPKSLAAKSARIHGGGRKAVRALNILVAEDNTVNQKVIRQMLKMQGYASIDIVDNGKKAADTILSRALSCQADGTLGCYDLVLMDVQMPVMDGMEAAQTIRRTVPSEYQPFIVALTAQVMQGDRDRCLAVGMSDYISKPIAKEDLLRILTISPRLEVNQLHGGSSDTPMNSARQPASSAVSSSSSRGSTVPPTPTTPAPSVGSNSTPVTPLAHSLPPDVSLVDMTLPLSSSSTPTTSGNVSPVLTATTSPSPSSISSTVLPPVQVTAAAANAHHRGSIGSMSPPRNVNNATAKLFAHHQRLGSNSSNSSDSPPSPSLPRSLAPLVLNNNNNTTGSPPARNRMSQSSSDGRPRPTTSPLSNHSINHSYNGHHHMATIPSSTSPSSITTIDTEAISISHDSATTATIASSSLMISSGTSPPLSSSWSTGSLRLSSQRSFHPSVHSPTRPATTSSPTSPPLGGNGNAKRASLATHSPLRNRSASLVDTITSATTVASLTNASDVTTSPSQLPAIVSNAAVSPSSQSSSTSSTSSKPKAAKRSPNITTGKPRR